MKNLNHLADRATPRVPRTRTGRRVAAAAIGAGVVTGIVTGIAIDTFTSDSQVVVETRDDEPPPRVPLPGDDDAPAHSNPEPDDAGPDDEPAGSDGVGSETTVIDEDEASSVEPVDEEYELLNHECFALLDAYPEIVSFDPTMADRCVTDPAAALIVAVDLATEIRVLDAEYHMVVEQCRSMTASFPELGAPSGEDCYDDPWSTLDAIDEWPADGLPPIEPEPVDELEAYAIAVDACYAELEAWSILVDVDPTLVDGCHQDPEATLVLIDQYLDVRD